MLDLSYENKFEKDLTLAKKRKKKLEALYDIVMILRDNQQLPPKNRNHKLQGTLKNYWECHIESDWLLIYKKTKTHLILSRIGTHSDLFE